MIGLFSYLPFNETSLRTNETAKAIMVGVLVESVLGTIVHICDLYLFFSRYAVVQRVNTVERMFHWSAWIIGGSFGAITIMILPIYYTAESSTFIRIKSAVLLALGMASLLQILYFTLKCGFFLRRLAHWEEIQKNERRKSGGGATADGPGNGGSFAINTPDFGSDRRRGAIERLQYDRDNYLNLPRSSKAIIDADGIVHSNSNLDHREEEAQVGAAAGQMPLWVLRLKIIAYKSIGHAITSAFALIFCALCVPTGAYTYLLIKLLGMHLWFNWPLEAYFLHQLQRTDRSLTRPEREWIVMNLRHRTEGFAKFDQHTSYFINRGKEKGEKKEKKDKKDEQIQSIAAAAAAEPPFKSLALLPISFIPIKHSSKARVHAAPVEPPVLQNSNVVGAPLQDEEAIEEYRGAIPVTEAAGGGTVGTGHH
jgi:hypothetical protein